jgi:ATP synthase protein I
MAGVPSRDDERLSDRLDDLGKALDRRAAERMAKERPSSRVDGGAMALGMRAMGELAAAVTVGAGLGWAIDHGLGSEPWALIVGMAIGAVAGFWGVYRLAARSGASGAPGAGGDE